MKHSVKVLAAAALVLPLSGLTHEGEDHGAPAEAVPIVAAGVRTEAQTDALELVAVLVDKHLTLYLDRFATNEPVADAQVEVESGAFRAVARQATHGVYAVPAGPFAPPGKYPLVVSVQAGDVADLLTATIEVAQPAAVAEQARSWAAWWNTRAMAGSAGALLLAGVGVLVARRRQTRSQADAAGASAHV